MNEPGTLPDASGHFGPYGGMFVPETLMPALEELAREFLAAKADPEFQERLNSEPVMGNALEFEDLQ